MCTMCLSDRQTDTTKSTFLNNESPPPALNSGSIRCLQERLLSWNNHAYNKLIILQLPIQETICKSLPRIWKVSRSASDLLIDYYYQLHNGSQAPLDELCLPIRICCASLVCLDKPRVTVEREQRMKTRTIDYEICKSYFNKN